MVLKLLFWEGDWLGKPRSPIRSEALKTFPSPDLAGM